MSISHKIISVVIFITIHFIPQNQIFAQTFLADDPHWYDPDQLDMPAPAETVLSEFYDFYENSFQFPGKKTPGPAQNINTLGEVPNSSWYTNRHYYQPMTIDELKRGPNQGQGPATSGKWEIIAGKGQGVTPGFTIKDSEGNTYLIKFDPPTNPEMTTGAEIISTVFFYALGYFTPENYLVKLKPEQLSLSPEARTETPLGKKQPLTQEIVNEMLSKAPKNQDGSFRVIASKFLNGQPLGHFRYYGTRPDDGNDIYPHEARRELRGLRIFCAWLNHDDSRSVNSLDVLVKENNRQFVRHYLIDFGSTLGSGSVFAQNPRAGNEYIFEVNPSLRSLFTLGFWVRSWAKVQYPDYPSIGRFEGNFFDPEKWKTEYPNPAFLNCDSADSFWAAKQVMNFTDEEIRGIVSLGQFTNKEAENYLVETLIKRRDKIGQAYLNYGGGIDKFRVENEKQLVFEDLLSKHKLVENAQRRKIIWREFDNQIGQIGPALEQHEFTGNKVQIPFSTNEFFAAAIETAEMGTTTVFVKRISNSYKVVGIRRK